MEARHIGDIIFERGAYIERVVDVVQNFSLVVCMEAGEVKLYRIDWYYEGAHSAEGMYLCKGTFSPRGGLFPPEVGK